MGETEVGVVAFVDDVAYAVVNYPSINGKTRIGYLPLSVLEVVPSAVGNAKRAQRV
jgi:hypothetical protein